MSNEDLDLELHRLDPEEHDRIFRDEIVPQELAGLTRQQSPVAVFVGGQPGAGKTKTTTESVLDALTHRGTPAHVCGDFYKPFHPRYASLLAEDDSTAGAYTRLDARGWHARAEEYARAQHADVVIETAMTGPDGFADPARRFRDNGYTIEVAILAVPAAQSRLGILHRYDEQLQAHGHGRLVTPENHDNCYRGMLQTADAIDRDRAADVVTVYRRGNHALHIAQLDGGGQWTTPPATRLAIEQERERPWSAGEVGQFLNTLEHLARHPEPGWHAGLRAVAELAKPYLPAGSHHAVDRLAAAVPASPQARNAGGVAAEGFTTPAPPRHPTVLPRPSARSNSAAATTPGPPAAARPDPAGPSRTTRRLTPVSCTASPDSGCKR